MSVPAGSIRCLQYPFVAEAGCWVHGDLPSAPGRPYFCGLVLPSGKSPKKPPDQLLWGPAADRPRGAQPDPKSERPLPSSRTITLAAWPSLARRNPFTNRA
jgi:hypothetical protein